MNLQQAQAILTQSETDRLATVSGESTLIQNKKAALLSYFQDIWPIFQVINNTISIGGKPALFGNTGTTAQARTLLENQINNKVFCGFSTPLTPNLELKVKFYVNDALVSSVRFGLKTPNYESMREFSGIENNEIAADYLSDIIVKYKD